MKELFLFWISISKSEIEKGNIQNPDNFAAKIFNWSVKILSTALEYYIITGN